MKNTTVAETTWLVIVDGGRDGDIRRYRSEASARAAAEKIAQVNPGTTASVARIIADYCCICGPEWRNPDCDQHGNARQECVRP